MKNNRMNSSLAWFITLGSIVLATATSSRAAMSPAMLIEGQVVAFNESTVRLMVGKVPVVIPRKTIPHSENLRADTEVKALVSWDDIQPDHLGAAILKKNAQKR